jgi:hypothetical protein
MQFKSTSGKPIAFLAQWMFIQSLWLAVEDRGVEIQLLALGKKNNKEARKLAMNAHLFQKSPVYHFPLLPAEVLSMFNIQFRATNFEKGTDKETGTEEDVDFENESMMGEMDDSEKGGYEGEDEFEEQLGSDDDNDDSMGYLES